MVTGAERQTEWARLVIDSLVHAGIENAVISPGSRSTPFVLAALRNESLRCTSAIDERSAAHYALGQARSTLLPSLLVCTSGSAAANYFPAVIEANEAGIPLIVISADRPPELQHCGANQTTDQTELFGKHVRFFANLGEPRDDELSLRALRRLVARAVTDATGVRPGPVHLNAQARKPLEPVVTTAELRARVDRILGEPLIQLHRARPLPPALIEPIPDLVVDAVVEAFDEASRPVIVCGPADVRNAMFVDALTELSVRTGAPILAQFTSQFRCWSRTRALGAFDTIWRTEAGRSSLAPDFVLQLGAAPVSSGWEQLGASTRIRRVVVHPWEWADPSSDAIAIVQADIGSLLTAVGQATFDIGHRDSAFCERFRRADALVWKLAGELLKEAGGSLTEGASLRILLDAAPDPSVLVLGNSLPIRDAETWGPPSKKLLIAHCQRGVSGIDGVVSGAAGVASCVDGTTTLAVGDISFLHDINGLQLAAGVEGPLVIVVINNGGGRIFEELPIARLVDDSVMRYFTTPHEASFESAAAVHGCNYARASTETELRDALAAAYATNGCTVVEAVVLPQSARTQSAELQRRVQEALRGEAL